MSFLTPQGNEADKVYTFSVYDKYIGRIRHIHQEVFLHGYMELTRPEIESKRSELVINYGYDLEKMDVLNYQSKTISPSSNYRVDIKSKKVIEVRKGTIKND